jgi:hypothetical protein
MKLLVLAVILTLVGCAESAGISPIGKVLYAPTDPTQVKFFIDTQAIKRNYIVLGYVSAELSASANDRPVEDSLLIASLKAKAATLGADGIVLESMFVDNDTSFISGFKSNVERKRARAAAIKFN